MHNAESQGRTDEKLETDPSRGRGVDFEGVDESDGDGGERGGSEHDLLSASGLHDDSSASECEHGGGEHKRQVVDAGSDGARFLDALEVDGEIDQEDDIARSSQ